MKIEKRNYSSNPWRLVTDGGKEVSVPTEIDTGSGGKALLSWPICGPTRSNVEAQALGLLERLLHQLAAKP